MLSAECTVLRIFGEIVMGCEGLQCTRWRLDCREEMGPNGTPLNAAGFSDIVTSPLTAYREISVTPYPHAPPPPPP